MVKLSKEQQIQEEEYFFPYHYSNLLSPFTDIEYVSYIKMVKNLISPLGGLSLLDFGCGDGRFEYELRDENCEVVGVDFSNKAIFFARAFNFNNPTAKFYASDIFKFSYPKKFDYVVTIETLEHINPKELKAVLARLNQFLKKKGKLIITIPSKNLPLSPKHYQHFNEKILREYLNDTFKIDKLIGQHYLGFRLNLFRTLNVFGRLLESLFPRKISDYYASFLLGFYKYYIELSPLSKAKRLIVVCSKK